jgi:sugar O-acyltransferase (sialic acid O-acetyltransferase NeuD family)
MAARSFVVIGSGGHAKVVIATIEACGDTVRHILDDDPRTWTTTVLGYPVKGPIGDDLIHADCVAVVAIGTNRARRHVVSRLQTRFASVVHPSAIVHRSVTIGDGAVIFAGAIVQPDTTIGAHSIVNTAASIDHDGQVGAFSHVAPGVHLAGSVRIGEGALVGVGASIIVGMTVGAWAIVGAGSVVIRPVEQGVTVAGCPARPLSEVS